MVVGVSGVLVGVSGVPLGVSCVLVNVSGALLGFSWVLLGCLSACFWGVCLLAWFLKNPLFESAFPRTAVQEGGGCVWCACGRV